MKLHRIYAGLFIGVLLLGLATIVSADDPDDPPKSANDPPKPTSTLPLSKGRFDPIPSQDFELVLDPAAANVTRMRLVEDDESVVPAAPPAAASLPATASPPVKGNFAPGPIMMGQFDGETFQTIPNSADSANDLLIGSPGQNDSNGHLRFEPPDGGDDGSDGDPGSI